MSFIVYVIVIAVTGIIVGALARFALPGKDPMSLGQTMLIGIGGSLVGGLITYAIWDTGTGNIALSVLCATVIMYFVRRSRGGGLVDPGRPPLDR